MALGQVSASNTQLTEFIFIQVEQKELMASGGGFNFEFSTKGICIKPKYYTSHLENIALIIGFMHDLCIRPILTFAFLTIK